VRAVRTTALLLLLHSGGFTTQWETDEPRQSKFIFIGKNLDKEELTDKFMACVAAKALRFKEGDAIQARRSKVLLLLLLLLLVLSISEVYSYKCLNMLRTVQYCCCKQREHMRASSRYRRNTRSLRTQYNCQCSYCFCFTARNKHSLLHACTDDARRLSCSV
jgi:Cobalamin synthesis protein cobW C-terminal domain